MDTAAVSDAFAERAVSTLQKFALVRHVFPLRGISSSVGFPNFPMSVWLYALPLFISPHPYAATLFTGLLNTLSVAASYWLVRRYWGPTAAIAAALLYATNPWA